MDKLFKNIKRLGKGTYSYVYKGINKNGETVVIKEFRRNEKDYGLPLDYLRETSSLKRCNHENIVKLLDFFMVKNKYYTIMPYYKTTLRKFYKHDLNNSIIKYISYKLLLGIHHMHSKGIVHRDIKSSNIMIDIKYDNNGNVKEFNPIIIDTGMSRTLDYYKFGSRTPTDICTIWYRAPEIILNYKNYNQKIDIWSMACIIVEMFDKDPILKGNTNVEQLYKQFELCGTPNEISWPEIVKSSSFNTFPQLKGNFNTVMSNKPNKMVKLLSNMFVINPNKRFSCCQCLNHVYFKNMPKSIKVIIDKECEQIKINYSDNIEQQLYYIDQSYRSLIVNWMLELSIKYELFDSTIFKGVAIMDKYLMKNKNDKKEYQIIALTSLYMATKLDEVYAIDVLDLIQLSDDLYNVNEILDTERKIFNSLEGDFMFPVMINYLQGNIFSDEEYELLLFYLYMSLYQFEYVNYTPKNIVNSAIKLLLLNNMEIQKFLNENISDLMLYIYEWSEKYNKNYTGITNKFKDKEWFQNRYMNLEY